MVCTYRIYIARQDAIWLLVFLLRSAPFYEAQLSFRQHALRQAVADFGVSFRGGKELIEQRLDLGVAKRFKSLWAISHGI